MASLRSLFSRSQQLRPSILAAAKTSATSTTTITATTATKRRTTTPTIQRSCAAAAFSSSATTSSSSAPSTRPSLHSPRVPTPTPFIPDVETFLTVIGRNLKQHASKFPTWDSLFALSSQQMRDLGVEPARSRKYLMRWRRRFLNEEYGPGGEFQHVKDGVAELRVLEVQKKKNLGSGSEPASDASAVPAPPVRMRCVVNMPEGVRVEDVVGTADAQKYMSRVIKYKPQGRSEIVGPYAIPLAHGKGASVTVTEGMWEDKQGHKIDGGERRQTKVRYKKRILERRQARERAQGHN